MLRLFAALAIPDFVAEPLTRIQRGVAGAKWRPRENFHITLRFFGEMDERQAYDLDGELSAISARAFDLELAGTGVFGGAEPHSLWAGVRQPNEALDTLARRCETAARKAALPPDTRTFHPHLTLAYLNRADENRLASFLRRHAHLTSEPWRAQRFGLYSSWLGKGPSHYQLETDYPLG